MLQNQLTDKQSEKDQIGLNLAQTKGEFWYNFKNKLNWLEVRFENIPFWKHFISAFSLVNILITTILPLLVVYIFWDQVPIKVPLFYSQSTSSWTVYPKIAVFLVGILVGFLELTVYYLSYKIYSFDRRLSLILNYLLVMVSALYLIAMWQILTLMLV